jgi:tape measure domain-containing protein
LSITAAQLVAEVSIQGADQAIGDLTEIGAASKDVQSGFDASGEAADMLAGVIIDLSNQLFDSFANMTDSIDNVRLAIDDMSSNATTGFETLNESISSISGQADEAATSLENVGTAAESASSGGFGSLMMSVGMTFFNFQMLAGIVKNVASGLLQPAISAETVTTALTTLDGSAKAAGQEMDKLNAFAAKTPFKTLDIDQAAEKLQGFGIQASNVIPDITAIGDALGSVGKSSPAEMQAVVDIFGKINTEGKVSAMTMNELAVHGINGWKALADATGKTIPQVQAMVKSGLLPAKDAIADLTKGIEMNPLYAGGMAKAAGTFTGLLSTLQSNWDQVIAAFGTPIIKALEGSLNNLGSILASPAFQDFAGAVGQGIVGVFQGIGGAVQYIGNIFKSLNLTDFLSLWHSIGDEIGSITTKFQGAGDIFKTVGTDMDPIANIIGEIAHAGLDTVTNVLAGISGALMDIDKAASGSGFGSLGSMFKQVSGIIGGQVSADFKTFSGILKSLGDWWKNTMAPTIASVMPSFERLGSTIMTTVVPAFAQIWAAGQQVMRQVLPPLTQAFETIAPVVVRVGGFLANQLGAALKFIMPFAVQAAQAIGQFADQIITRVTPIVKELWAGIQGFLDWIKPYWPEIWGGIQTTLLSVWDIIKGAVQIAWSLISGIIKVGLDLLSGNWKQAWKDVQDTFSGVWDGIKSIAEGVWAGISGAVKGGINDIINLINGFIGFIDGIQIHIPAIGVGPVHTPALDWNGVGIPKIPLLAKGGTVTQGGFGVVGDDGPEGLWLPQGAQVAPNNQLNAMLAGASNGGNNRPLILQIDGRQFAQAFLPSLSSEMRYRLGTKF